SVGNRGINGMEFEKDMKEGDLEKEMEWWYEWIVNEGKEEDRLLRGNGGDVEFLCEYYELYWGEKDVYEVLLGDMEGIWGE
ncbi:hypothetical protein, partial [Bacillus thuringiensis]|uniref:hypothetical protein n=1 Tax=Bacillus thuringiensis TaxID=1428 RepID=UPI001C92C9B7